MWQWNSLLSIGQIQIKVIHTPPSSPPFFDSWFQWATRKPVGFMQSCCYWRTTYDIRTSSTHHVDNIRMSSACHPHVMWTRSACHLHIQNLPELPNFMTWLVFICYIVSAESSSQLVLILSLIFGWTLSVKDVLLISFGRKFCNLFLNQSGFEDCFWYMFCFWVDLPVLGQ